jgi:hypothetical protein
MLLDKILQHSALKPNRMNALYAPVRRRKDQIEDE